ANGRCLAMPLRLGFPEHFGAYGAHNHGHVAIAGHHPYTILPCDLGAGSEGIGEHRTRQDTPFVWLEKWCQALLCPMKIFGRDHGVGHQMLSLDPEVGQYGKPVAGIIAYLIVVTYLPGPASSAPGPACRRASA